MSFFHVDPEVYAKYRDRVIAMGQSQQVNYKEDLPPDQRRPGYSDEQIAAELGLDKRTVTEIRCVAEREYYGVEEWQQAIDFKEQACRGYADRGVSHATAKYLKGRKKQN